MPENEVVESSEKVLVPIHPTEKHEIEIPGALPVKHQTLDLARHVAIAPDEKRYIVATYNDTLMGRGIVTSVFPQQNGYMTLVRLPVCEFSTDDEEQALQRHREVVLAIQRGEIKAYLQQNNQEHASIK
jgi:hypothetical protein